MNDNSQLQLSIRANKIAEAIPVYYMAKRVPLFLGPPGIAKTAFVRVGANTIGPDVVVRELHLASMSEVDVRGYLIPQGDLAKFTAPEFWATVMQHPRGILFLDEFVQASHEVQKAVAPLILEGRIGEYVLPTGWSVALAGNNLDDGAGANTLLSHIVNRVQIINVTPPDVDEWAMWAINAGLPFELIAFAKALPHLVFNGAVPEEPNAPYCTPRSVHSMGDTANAFPGGLRSMVDSDLGMAMIQGAIGMGPAVELVQLVRNTINLPSFDDVVRNPGSTRVPTSPSEAYAMVMLCSVRAQVDTIESVMQYLERFQTNFSITGVISLIRRDKRLAQNKRMLAWVMANRDVLMKFNKYITEAL